MNEREKIHYFRKELAGRLMIELADSSNHVLKFVDVEGEKTVAEQLDTNEELLKKKAMIFHTKELIIETFENKIEGEHYANKILIDTMRILIDLKVGHT